MKKRIFVAVLCFMTLIGCSKKNSDTIDSAVSEESIVNEVLEEENEETDVEFSFSSSLNILQDGVPLGNKLTINEQQNLELTLCLSADLEAEFVPESFTTELRIFVDNKLAEFSIDGIKSDKGCVVFDIIPVMENTFELNIDVDEKVKNINICVLFFPDYVPEMGSTPFDGSIGYLIHNELYESEKGDSQDIHYVNVEGIEDGFALDVGNIPVSEENLQVVEPHSKADVVSDYDKPVYVKFYSGNECQYYLYVTCDGELLPAFAGKELILVDCYNGKRVFQYDIDRELLPESGLHVIQATVIPIDEDGQHMSDTSQRIRIQCE